jgi:hypothetical protein
MIQEMIIVLRVMHMYNESSSNYVIIFLKFQNTWGMLWNKLGNIHGLFCFQFVNYKFFAFLQILHI